MPSKHCGAVAYEVGDQRAAGSGFQVAGCI